MRTVVKHQDGEITVKFFSRGTGARMLIVCTGWRAGSGYITTVCNSSVSTRRQGGFRVEDPISQTRTSRQAEAEHQPQELDRIEAELDRVDAILHRINGFPNDPSLRNDAGMTFFKNGQSRSNSLILDAAWLPLSYTLARTEKSVDYRVRLRNTQPRYGGPRCWFTCPLGVNCRACERLLG
jgi:hypothetical protein